MAGRTPLNRGDVALPVWTPPALRRVIRKATQRDMASRYQSAREMDCALANAVVLDWRHVEGDMWEASFRHRAGFRVQVIAQQKRSGVRLSTRVNRGSGWRRATQDVDASDLRSTQAHRVFDQATEMASVR
jgi:hypothetical protein